jgi:uncharacterized protein
MSTTQVTALLFQLQQLDLELDRMAAELQVIDTSLQEDSSLRKLRAEFETAQQQLQAGLQAQKEAEWTLDDLEHRLKEQDLRLYNGSVSNAKELQALQLEAQRLKAQQSRQEDTLLQVIDVTESLSESVQRKQSALKQAEDFWQQEHEGLIVRHTGVENRIQELQSKRIQLASGIQEGLLKRYDTMRRTKQGRAVSKVEQNSCQWCRVILTPSELQHARISAELQMCSNCGRILYYDR